MNPLVFALKHLYTFLSITALTPECFYSQNLLPQFQFLPREAKAVHLKHIKDNLLKTGFGKQWNADETELIDALQRLPFIETKDGTLCKASEFFSIKEDVFRVMCPPTVFPPSPYNSLEWHHFLVLAGMIDKVSVNNFVRFANEVHILGKQIITENVASMSNTLVKHLFGRPNLLQENLLSQIKHIKFVLPFCIKKQHKHGKTLDCIHEQYESGSQLIAFNGSVSFRSCYLVWSSCTLFPELPHLDKKLFFQLGCQNIPQKDDVIIHLKNISCSLKGKPAPAEFKTCLEEIMTSCYKYLQENGVTEHDKQYLEAYPVIYLNDSRCMVRACDIVINLAKEDAIPGYIYQSPVYFGQFFDVFEELGASTIVSANHYAKVLLEKHLDIGEHKLDPNEWKVVQKAVAMLFTCLSDNRYSKELSVSNLYLPSSKETLVCSKDLVLSNYAELQERISSLNLTYFIGFKALKIPAFDPVRFVCYLPEEHRPSILTSLVQEHVTAECQEQAYHDTHSNMYLHCMSSTPFISGVVRLVNHQSYHNYSTLITEQEASSIAKIFQNIQIREVYDLRTNLVYSELPVAGSERKVNCFSEFSPAKDGNILYLDTDACGNNFDMCYQISDEIDKIMKGQIGKKINCISQMLQMDGNDISLYLDKQKILGSDFHICESDKGIFPPPGTLIPEDFHWMLNNNFESLNVDEYVGLEVYDPMVNEILNSTSSMESSDAVYIYAIVRKITEQNDSPMMSKYCVEVGKGRVEELNATKLYKFCRHKTSSRRELVLSSAPTGSPPSSPDLNDVLKEIRQTLKDAWLRFDEHDRQRVVKRLYLKWHPDKNDQDREQLCTRVCQYIQFYVTKLNRGENIDDTEEKHSWSPPPPFESSYFFTNMDRRSRSQRNCYDSHQHRLNTTLTHHLILSAFIHLQERMRIHIMEKPDAGYDRQLWILMQPRKDFQTHHMMLLTGYASSHIRQQKKP
ncbi:sacsin-like [Gigantopelta aegis]|uniref:sacsin-like n=1 Tax=Gigantopelta aegis TaxID=1735272 RepID=UPI001B88DF91|nr:sacsin-like [Gigantopelta aegis]